MRVEEKIHVQMAAIVVGLVIGLTVAPESRASPINSPLLSITFANDAWFVAVGRCGANDEGVLASRVNQENTNALCLTPVMASRFADDATKSLIPEIGQVGGTEVIRVEAGAANSAQVRQVFTVIAAPANPLDLPVDRLSYYQAKASNCSERAHFSFTRLEDRGSHLLRGWGERDVRVNPAYDLPEGWTIEDLRRELLFEQATFRGIVERPTFDILHPFAERPLLVTVFELLPAARTADRCSVVD